MPESQYVVQHGESLASISKKLFGTEALWAELAERNGLAPPYTIYTGQVGALAPLADRRRQARARGRRGPRHLATHFAAPRRWLRDEFLPFWVLMRPHHQALYLRHWPPPTEAWRTRLQRWNLSSVRLR